MSYVSAPPDTLSYYQSSGFSIRTWGAQERNVASTVSQREGEDGRSPKNHTEAGVTLPDPKASVHAEER